MVGIVTVGLIQPQGLQDSCKGCRGVGAFLCPSTGRHRCHKCDMVATSVRRCEVSDTSPVVASAGVQAVLGCGQAGDLGVYYRAQTVNMLL